MLPLNKSILLIDDDGICSFLSTKVLQNMGIFREIHTAVNGKEAIDFLNSYFQRFASTPDIILLDLNMPVMNGFGFLEAFKTLLIANKERIKIIIVTSSPNQEDISKARKMGIEHYLIKPISEKKLMAALQHSADTTVIH
jgi:CheY-like chemotaxis protein